MRIFAGFLLEGASNDRWVVEDGNLIRLCSLSKVGENQLVGGPIRLNSWAAGLLRSGVSMTLYVYIRFRPMIPPVIALIDEISRISVAIF